MTALVVEDGTGVANAATLATEAETLAYAQARGKTFPTVEADQQKYLLQAMDYINSLRNRYQGTKTYATQALQFPRDGLVIDGIDVANNVIPVEAKLAQIVLAIEAANGVELMPTTTGKFVTEKTIGPITTKFSEKIGTTSEPEISKADALLQPLFSSPGGFTLRTVRI